MSRPRVKVPSSAAPGEVVTIKTLISHPMESGRRTDSSGAPIPRKIIHRFTAQYNGAEVFALDLAPAISANPFIEFHLRVMESGELTLTWHEDGGETFSSSSTISVNSK